MVDNSSFWKKWTRRTNVYTRKGIEKWWASVDETRKYFVTMGTEGNIYTHAQQIIPGQKFRTMMINGKEMHMPQPTAQLIAEYTAELDIVLGNAYLLQGMCYDRLDQRGKAKGSYKDCIALDNFSGSIKIARDYLKKPFSGM